MSDLLILQRLLLVTAVAGAIGYERERHGRAAGFRTHILVGVGSCLIMLTGLYLAEAVAGPVELDPTRMAAQVISGIGFLGAGTILRSRASVRGLTTAASLWAVGGVGLAIGAGFLWGALVTSGLLLMVLFGLSRMERAMRKEQYQVLIVEVVGSWRELARIREALTQHEVELRDFDVHEGPSPDRLRLEFQVKLVPDHPRQEIISDLSRVEGVQRAHWA